MMVLAAAVRTKSSFSFFRTLFCCSFRHCDHPSRRRIGAALSQRIWCRTSTGEDSNAVSLQQKSRETGMENIAAPLPRCDDLASCPERQATPSPQPWLMEN
jgi:hypothetical protein